MDNETYVKVATAIEARLAEKRAEAVRVKIAERITTRLLEKQAVSVGGAFNGLSGLVSRVRMPKVNIKGKYNPLRLFASKVSHLPADGASAARAASSSTAGASSGYSAIGDLAGGSGYVDEYRLSPAKILTAIGLASGTAGGISALKGNKPAVSQAPKANSVNRHAVAALLASLGLGGIGGTALAMSRVKADKDEGKGKD